MIKLKTSFVSGEGGFSADPLTYTQLIRNETCAVYERSRNGVAKDFEVFRIKILPKGTQVFQKVTEDDEEKYPGASIFGKSAWSCGSKLQAMRRYEELIQKMEDDANEDDQPQKALIVPVEFTMNEFAEANGMGYPSAVLSVKSLLEAGSVKFVREERRNVKGKPSKIYAKV